MLRDNNIDKYIDSAIFELGTNDSIQELDFVVEASEDAIELE